MKTLLYKLFLGLSLLLLGSLAIAAGAPGGKPDWSRVADLAKQRRVPVMIVFNAPDCPYCERLEREVIAPMSRQGALEKRVVVREFSIATGGKVRDFDGDKVRARRFVNRYHVFATPTVMFLDAAGRPLTDPIVGFRSADDYQQRLEKALGVAQAMLNPPKGKAAVARATLGDANKGSN